MYTGFVFWVYIFIVDFISIAFFWLVCLVAEKGMNLTSLHLFFHNRRYYYLTFIHELAYAEKLDGKTDKEILKLLKKRPFAFLMNNEDADKYKKDKDFIIKILDDNEILEEFILQKNFDKKVFQKICARLNEHESLKELDNMFSKILIDPSDEGRNKATNVFKWWLTAPFPASKTFSKLTNGKNQLLLYMAVREILIKEKTTQKFFTSCLMAIKKIEPSITVVTISAMSQTPRLRDNEITTCKQLIEAHFKENRD